jgi:hypothetical protein
MRNTFCSWIALTLLYPQHTMIYINTHAIIAITENVATERSKGTLVSTGGGVRVNVKETPEEILKLIEKAGKEKE